MKLPVIPLLVLVSGFQPLIGQENGNEFDSRHPRWNLNAFSAGLGKGQLNENHDAAIHEKEGPGAASETAGESSSDPELQALEMHLNRVSIGPKGELLGYPEDTRVLIEASKNYVEPSWEKFKELLPEHQSKITLAALENLDDRAYLEAVGLIFEGVADGDVSPKIGRDVLWSPYREGILAVNYRDPRIKAVLPRMLPLYADDAHESGYLRTLISGEAKKNYREWCWNNSLTPIRAIDGGGEAKGNALLCRFFRAAGAVILIGCMAFLYYFLPSRARTLRT